MEVRAFQGTGFGDYIISTSNRPRPSVTIATQRGAWIEIVGPSVKELKLACELALVQASEVQKKV